MSVYEALSLIAAGIAIIVSLVSYSRSNAVAHGMIELEVKNMITKSQERVQDLSVQMLPLISIKEKTEEHKKQLEGLGKVFRAAVESNINAYEEACAKYLDKKIDRRRFKKIYQVSLRQLVENPEHKQYFDGVTSRYKAILKVYNEWENPER